MTGDFFSRGSPRCALRSTVALVLLLFASGCATPADDSSTGATTGAADDPTSGPGPTTSPSAADAIASSSMPPLLPERPVLRDQAHVRYENGGRTLEMVLQPTDVMDSYGIEVPGYLVTLYHNLTDGSPGPRAIRFALDGCMTPRWSWFQGDDFYESSVYFSEGRGWGWEDLPPFVFVPAHPATSAAATHHGTVADDPRPAETWSGFARADVGRSTLFYGIVDGELETDWTFDSWDGVTILPGQVVAGGWSQQLLSGARQVPDWIVAGEQQNYASYRLAGLDNQGEELPVCDAWTTQERSAPMLQVGTKATAEDPAVPGRLSEVIAWQLQDPHLTQLAAFRTTYTDNYVVEWGWGAASTVDGIDDYSWNILWGAPSTTAYVGVLCSGHAVDAVGSLGPPSCSESSMTAGDAPPPLAPPHDKIVDYETMFALFGHFSAGAEPAGFYVSYFPEDDDTFTTLTPGGVPDAVVSGPGGSNGLMFDATTGRVRMLSEATDYFVQKFGPWERA